VAFLFKNWYLEGKEKIVSVVKIVSLTSWKEAKTQNVNADYNISQKAEQLAYFIIN